MPDDKDSCVSSGDTSTHEHEEEEDSDDFFEGGEGAVGDRLSLSAASERSQSGGGTEDDPVGPVTLSAVLIMGSGTMSRKATTVDFSRTISSDSADLEDEEWVDPTPIPVTDAPSSRLFSKSLSLDMIDVARDRGIVHMINTRARTSLDRT